MKLSPYVAAMLLTAIGFAGCASPVNSEKKATPPFTLPNGGTWADPSNPDPTDPASEVAGFFVKVSSTTATLKTHRADVAYGGDPGTTNFSTECRIPVGTTLAADRDILCIAEIEELDAFFSELSIQYHYPPSMCSYAKFMPYHFYAYEPGVGLTNLSRTYDVSGAVVASSAGVNATTGAPECDYDYSLVSSSLPNCCEGTYALTTTQQQVAPDPDVVTTTTASWGGNTAGCLSGPGTSDSHAGYISANGYPMTKVEYVENTGLNKTFRIGSPITANFNGSVLMSSNLWTANFYRVSDHSAQSPLVLPADRPLALRVPANAAVNYQPSDVYRFECHDRAEEIQYRIRLMIREWNSDGDLAEGGDPEVNVGTDPNVPGGPINDRSDWFDIGNAYPAASL